MTTSTNPRTAVVTGASGGIGEEFARLLVKDGYRVVLVARTEDKLRAVVDELNGGGATGPASYLVADLSDPSAPVALFAAVSALSLGPVDLLINNAGAGKFGEFASIDISVTDAMVELNINALTKLTRLFLPAMIDAKRGTILNVASVAAFQAGPLMAVYYATKAYVLSFTEAIAEELRGTGVTVTALCPGLTTTGFQAAAAMEQSRLMRNMKIADARSVAAYGLKAAASGTVVAVPGVINKVLVASVRLVPRRALRRVVHKMQAAR